MVQILASVKNTFVHVDTDSPDCVEMGNSTRRRASSTPPRANSDAAVNDKFRALGAEDLLLLPHDDDDYTSMHAHPGPSPLDMDVEGMLSCRLPETDIESNCWSRSVSGTKDESTPELANGGMENDDAASKEMEEHSASAPVTQGSTCGALMPNDHYRESLAQSFPCLSAAPMTPQVQAQRQLLSTCPLPPREAQRDSFKQTHSGNSPARVLREEKHEEMQGEEKRTTVMLMNVPLRYTSSKLMSTFDAEGFASMYDFIYVPMTVARNSKGYAFVNWVDPSVAQRFLKAFDGFSKWSTSSKNVGRAVWAKQHQGLQTNIERYRNSTVLGKTVPDEYKPRIFENGVEMPFPQPLPKPSMPTQRAGQSRQRAGQPRKKHLPKTLSL